ncbi:C40 family peptidase [Pseudoflavonifractor sp. NSJ-25]|uniref:C40 family peptidase n=2 Tax=Pseudoflavonifractor hominis TaxID=2763059 RepID=A0ABR7HPV5_9FIRM|nr:C40 family peptidase [Pseudoflavonifractor hominis]
MVPAARAALEALPASLSPQRRALLEHACTLVGHVPYFWGGKSAAPGWDPAWGELRQVTAPGCADSGKRLPYGLDCSGLVSWAAANTLEDSDALALVGDGVRAQYAASTPIDWSDLLPGDLLCFPDLSHIGLALTPAPDGTVPVLHCSRSLGGVVITADAAGAGFALAARPGWLPAS